LETYKDFINAIAGTPSNSTGAIKRIGGNARWEGKITDPGGETTFLGHVRGERVYYEGVALDSVEGDLTYSPSELTVAKGHVRRGAMETEIDGGMELTGWSFLPDNEWSAEVSFEKVPVESMQQLFVWNYPVRGLLTGQLHGRGTKAAPAVTGLFDLADGNAYGLSFNRLRGQINILPDEVRIANAELRFFPPEKEGKSGAGIVTGTAGYRFADGTITADLAGASIPLENFGGMRSARIPLGGQVSFRLRAGGAATAPTGEGTFRVVDLRIGQEVIGSFDVGLTSDGHTAKVELSSAMATGEISGGYTVGLVEPYPINGKVAIKNINLDPFLMSALHLEKFEGHGVADGDIAVSGDLKNAEKIVVDAQFSKLVLNYAKVQLENSSPVHLRTSRDELQIDPVTFQGADTNIQIDGELRFTGNRTVNMHLNGALDLRLLSGFVPDLEAHGPAQVNAAIDGTFESPRITGKVHIENAAARAADFPTGLSAIKGDMVFDATRLFFEDVTAVAGGGTLHVSGSVSYADRPLRYDITARTDG
ncbi:MAG: hypothetical protein ACRD36_04750, partial [Candidatus Acidiferrum sp.]